MFSMPFDSVAQGFALSFGLIVAIGAQNAFVLRQGLRREHIVSIVLFCAAVDAALITAGVLGMAEIIGRNVVITRALAACGAIFLLIYGWVALRRAMSPGWLEAARGGEALSYTAALLQVAAFTLLNPHVYLDTLLLVGSIGAQHPDSLRGWFILGACSASVVWFSLLGFGAVWLAPLFARPRAWQVLDTLIGIIMWLLALSLVSYLVTTL